MMTRNLFIPTHSAGMPTSIPNAHGMMAYGPYVVTPTPSLTLPPESIMFDPSNPPSDPYEQHYVSDYHTPVATRNLFFASNSNPYTGIEDKPGNGLPVSTRPVF